MQPRLDKFITNMEIMGLVLRCCHQQINSKKMDDNDDSIVKNIFVKVEECDDTDSNKTEVEEIEMVDMEGRAEVKPFSKIQTDNLFFQKSTISQYPQ